MTDYLELLLDEVAAEDGTEEQNWGGTNRPVSVARRSDGVPDMPQGTERISEMQQVQAAASAVRLSGELARLERAAQRSMQMAVSGPAVQEQSGDSISIPVVIPTVSAAQVDAAFQRDARRYDGPLRLL